MRAQISNRHERPGGLLPSLSLNGEAEAMMALAALHDTRLWRQRWTIPDPHPAVESSYHGNRYVIRPQRLV